MKNLLLPFAISLTLLGSPALAQTRTICTIVMDAGGGAPLVEEGDCRTRMSPASTFKVAISLMGFDAGILESETAPELPFKEGYVGWNPAWRQATTPRTWMRDSVVWYSQQVTQRLGMERYSSYVSAFGYGNEDLSGDPGQQNGLTHAWLSSSLRISPAEQVAFLRRLVRRELPVSGKAYEKTAAIMDHGVQPSGWRVFGKTGAGAPRNADGSLMMGRGFGWFVGWAEKDRRTVVFARLIQDSERQPTPPGLRARDALLADLFARSDSLR